MLLPLADGGDGSVEAAIASGFASIDVEVPDALGRPHRASIALRDDAAVVEVANTCGLAITPERGREVAISASSEGLGIAAHHAISLGARRLVLGLGGSVSTDAGTGFLVGLGARLLDSSGSALRPGAGSLHELADIDLSGISLPSGIELVAATDVRAPLTGRAGAAHVFGRQKGADTADLDWFDRGLEHAAHVISKATGRTCSTTVAGTGSAGGIGFAVAALGGEIVSGADYFLDLVGFDDHLHRCDIVVTGEGAVDRQTLLGKLPSVVAGRSSSRPVHLVVGRNLLEPGTQSPFTSIRAIADLTDQDSSGDPALTQRFLQVIGERIGIVTKVEQTIAPGSRW